MDTTKSSAPAHPPTTRTTRGLALYRERAGEITRVYPNVFRGPSCSGETFYTVHLSPRVRCDCPDFERHGGACKHIYCAEIAASKTRRRRSA